MHPVTEVRDVSILEPSDEVEFDVIATHVVEQPSAVPEEDRNQVDLHLVQLPGPQKCLGRPGPVDHDRPVPCGRASLTGAVLDIGDETRVAGWHVLVIHLVGEDEDRHAVVVVALPTPGEARMSYGLRSARRSPALRDRRRRSDRRTPGRRAS